MPKAKDNDKEPSSDTMAEGGDSELTPLYEAVASLTERVDALEARPIATPPNLDVNAVATTGFVPTHAAPDDIIEIVTRICGREFSVKVEEAEAGKSFRLQITPPPHLKESPDDVRAKVITYVEGSAGVERYATKVREFCRGWAFKNGVNYLAS